MLMRSAITVFTALVLLAGTIAGTSPSVALAGDGAVRDGCRIDAPRLDWGQGDYHNETAAAISIAVTCPAGIRYNIALLQAPQCSSLRAMTRGDAYIRYVILTPDRMAVWCDGTNGTATVASIGTGAPQYFVGFAKIVAGSPQSRIPDGRYDDRVDILIGDEP